MQWCLSVVRNKESCQFQQLDYKYIALGHTTREAVWIWKFINELGLNMATIKSIILQGDNEMSIVLKKKAKSQHLIKLIHVHHHYIRKLISNGELTIDCVLSFEMLANGMMKALPTEMFRKHGALLGMSVN